MLKNLIYFRHPNVNSVTSGESDGGGIVLKWFTDGFKEQITNLFQWILTGLFNILTPFIEWGCKIFIVWCVVLLYCSGDKKNISSGLKCLLIYIVFFLIKGALT